MLKIHPGRKQINWHTEWLSYCSAGANPFDGWDMAEWLGRWPQQWGARGVSKILGTPGSPLASPSWGNTLIIGIYAAATARRHFIMSFSYKTDISVIGLLTMYESFQIKFTGIVYLWIRSRLSSRSKRVALGATIDRAHRFTPDKVDWDFLQMCNIMVFWHLGIVGASPYASYMATKWIAGAYMIHSTSFNHSYSLESFIHHLNSDMWPLLLTWINLNPSMNK